MSMDVSGKNVNSGFCRKLVKLLKNPSLHFSNCWEVNLISFSFAGDDFYFDMVMDPSDFSWYINY